MFNGYCVFLGRALISWKTKNQPIVSRSTTKGEYCAMAATVCKFQRISYIICDFQLPLSTPIPLYCDNQVAIHIAGNHVFHERTKHLDIDCHLVWEKLKDGFISPQHVSSSD